MSLIHSKAWAFQYRRFTSDKKILLTDLFARFEPLFLNFLKKRDIVQKYDKRLNIH